MTDKELIQTLRCRDSGDCFKCGLMVVCGNLNAQAADRLEALLAENERLKAQLPKWVSVDERLPKYNRHVLCYRPDMAMKIVVSSYDGYYGDDDEEWYEGWSIYGYDLNGNCVITHWMPLPSTEGVE